MEIPRSQVCSSDKINIKIIFGYCKRTSDDFVNDVQMTFIAEPGTVKQTLLHCGVKLFRGFNFGRQPIVA